MFYEQTGSKATLSKVIRQQGCAELLLMRVKLCHRKLILEVKIGKIHHFMSHFTIKKCSSRFESSFVNT